jgi:hypothetical protein
MKKSIEFILISVIIILTVAGCTDKKKFEFDSAHQTWIKENGGKLWLNYAIVKSGLTDNNYSGEYIFLSASEDVAGDYVPIFYISKEDYQVGDFILSNSDYLYIFNRDKNTIIRYELSNNYDKKEWTNNKKNSILIPYGIKNKKLYFAYIFDDKKNYSEMDLDFNNIKKINDISGFPTKISYTPIR